MQDSEGPTHEEDTDREDVGEAPTSRAQEVLASRYRLGMEIGRGGMGEVIAAHDAQFGREVAVKRLHRNKVSDRSVHRFVREAHIQGCLDHPAIVPVHQLGEDGAGRPFFVMKKLAGTTLAKIIDGGRYARLPLLRAFADVCLAVEFAHTRGVIHRDLKPDNIVLGDFGEVYVLDWGVAKVASEGVLPTPDVDEPVTAAGVAIGTPGYMAPEQAQGRSIDVRADVYALGCILFEILAGQPLALRGASGAHGHPAARAPGRDIPPELDALCARAVAMDRDARIRTARELGEGVARFLDGDRDLGLRRELASQHFERARKAFADGEDEELRRIAMREAGRALALDPTLADAAELVGRLMLEPPRTTPREVETAVTADQLKTLRLNARIGATGFLGYLAFIPALVGHPRYALALVSLIAVNVAMALWNGYLTTRPRPVRVAIGNALIVGLLARMFSPFLLAPGVAAVTGMMLVFSPAYRRAGPVIALVAGMAAAVIVPWLAEVIGFAVSTMHATASGLALTAPGLQLSDAGAVTLLLLYTVGLIAAAVAMSFSMRMGERKVRHQMHLQAWQLRQLVPQPAAHQA